MHLPNDINEKAFFDVVVVGGGPAGLTAAIYLARARYRVLVLEKEQFGGQITITSDVVNYPGIEKISGKALTETMRAQAEFFGAEFLLTEAVSLDLDGDLKTVHTRRGAFHCFGILIATGAHPRTVGFQGEEEHKGRGVAYCATCDGEFFTGKDVFVIGGGYAAAEESVFLTKFARHVTILIRKDDFSCAASVAQKARSNEKITVLTNTIVEEVSGENGLNYIRYKNTSTGQSTEFRAREGDTFGVFVFAGYAPDTELVKGKVDLDAYGYIQTDTAQKTSVDGLYAAGDVCIKPLRQLVTATSDGALAATELEKYVATMQRKTGLHPVIPERKNQDTATKAPKVEATTSDNPFTPEMKVQLEGVFNQMNRSLVLKLYLDERPVSAELESYMSSLAALTDKLAVEIASRQAPSEIAPCVRVCFENGAETGLAFHGVPGGHEFTSFVLGLYNAAGPGQPLEQEILNEIATIQKPLDIKILVSLSCTMCPDLVIAVQRIAVENANIKADVYDIRHFEALKNRYNVMSVPCMVINDNVYFGKKNIKQILELLISN